jgi:succinate-acetate transporter protein
MAVTSAGWLVQGLSKVVPDPDPHFAGVALLAVAATIAVACASSWFGNAAAALVLTFTVARFLLSALHGLTGGEGLEDAAGVVGLVVTVLALYLALATELGRLRTAPDLPLLRRGASWENRREGFAGQLAGIEHEPGVRRQL